LSPEALAGRARELADVAGLECTVLDEEDLRAGNFGGILAVSQGSARPPRLIRLRHAPAHPKGKVALVGKGITFDSGGLSIKDAKSMETMKNDMAGAAAVIATMSALGRLGVNVEVEGFVPTCENMSGSRALKPGDVIVHRAGRTTEVNNTDAEGRLVLSDAITLACERKPDAVVDAATLTGGVLVALGRKSTGLFANDDALAGELERAAGSAGERLWRLPLYSDYRSELDSEVADMKNSGGRFGSSIIAALFLEEFVQGGVAWAHLDIAGTARTDSDSGELSRGATGVGVRTFLEWLEGRAADAASG
jgi:leucyl aminopeptidase